MTAREPKLVKKSLFRVPPSAKTGTIDHGLCENNKQIILN